MAKFRIVEGLISLRQQCSVQGHRIRNISGVRLLQGHLDAVDRLADYDFITARQADRMIKRIEKEMDKWID